MAAKKKDTEMSDKELANTLAKWMTDNPLKFDRSHCHINLYHNKTSEHIQEYSAEEMLFLPRVGDHICTKKGIMLVTHITHNPPLDILIFVRKTKQGEWVPN